MGGRGIFFILKAVFSLFFFVARDVSVEDEIDNKNSERSSLLCYSNDIVVCTLKGACLKVIVTGEQRRIKKLWINTQTIDHTEVPTGIVGMERGNYPEALESWVVADITAAITKHVLVYP